MKVNFSVHVATSLLAMVSAVSFAQSATPNTQPPNQNAQGMGKHHNDRCCGPNNTSGWSMMDKKERTEHREKLLAMKSYDECKAYADDHHTKMMDRAKEKGRMVPTTPRRDACAWLKK